MFKLVLDYVLKGSLERVGTKQGRRSMLHIAAQAREDAGRITKMLLDRDEIDVDVKDTEGRTPLWATVKYIQRL
jgi:hypothetical protein